MTLKRVLLSTVSLILVTAIGPWSPIDASIVAESDSHIWCSESGRESLPKKLMVMQVIDDRFFASAPFVSLEVFANYVFRFDVNSGKVIVTGVLIKPDGTELKLPKLVGRMRSGIADQTKSTDLVIERRDIIEWKVKLKGLPPLQGAMDCLKVEVGVVGSEMGTFQSVMSSFLAAVKSELK